MIVAGLAKESTDMANPVTWFEIIGKDGSKLQKFYGDLFGWKIDANNPMNYGMVDNGGQGINGGVGPGEGPRLTVYVEAADLDATLKKAESMGGKTVMPAMAVPNGPTIAMFSDPEGNIVGIMKPMQM
jgi:predicted enzyme related to lactoylglutathione lyase